ncbi:hypothetical protein ACFS4T_06810 [Pseudomonas lini]
MPQDFARGLGAVGVRRILLTASGGPFRQTPMAELAHVSPPSKHVRTRIGPWVARFRWIRPA